MDKVLHNKLLASKLRSVTVLSPVETLGGSV